MNYKSVKIEINSIYYIEKRRNQSVIHTESGEYTSYDTLSELYERLDKPRFTYCHQGYIINFEHVKSIIGRQVNLSAHISIPLSRTYELELKKRLMDQINAEREKQLLDESMQFHKSKK